MSQVCESKILTGQSSILLLCSIELVAGSKTPDSGVQNAMLRALYEVVSKAGSNISEPSRTSILGLIDSDAHDADGKDFSNYSEMSVC